MSCSGFAPNVDNGNFALRPLDYNKDRTELEVEFFWQPACLHGIDDRIPLSTLPSSSRDLDVFFTIVATIPFHRLSPMQSAFIKTGQRFTLKTPDPNELPLPSKELLDMQFVLSRLVSLSGAGE